MTAAPKTDDWPQQGDAYRDQALNHICRTGLTSNGGTYERIEKFRENGYRPKCDQRDDEKKS